MQLRSSSFADGGSIPEEYAFCVPDPASGVKPGPNRNPAFDWDGVPTEAGSLVLICHDIDAPTRQEAGAAEEVPADLPRKGFFHWVAVDIDPRSNGVAEGEFSSGVTVGGKGPEGPTGIRQGINDYTIWFAGDTAMDGTYYGYDGPCPPINDSIVHRYVFTLYALDVERCPVDGDFGGEEVLEVIEGHVLDQASITGTYALNPALRA